MIVNCYQCHKEINIPPSRSKNKTHHCSRKCSGITRSFRTSRKIKTNCVICNKELFYKQSHFKQIAKPTCSRKCSSKVHKIRYVGSGNPKSSKLTVFERIFSDRCKNLRLRAEAKKIEFNLTMIDLIDIYNKQNGKCFYSNLNMSLKKKGGIQYDTMSVDRIDSTKGYTKDNIVLCLNSINMFKAQHKLDDIKKVFRAIYMKEKNNIKVKIKKLYNDSQLPEQSDQYAAGYDLFVHRVEEDEYKIKIYTGISIQPELGFYFFLAPRSSAHKRGLILYNNLGIIDVNFTGELVGIFLKTKEYVKNTIQYGDRLLQLIPQEQIWVEPIEVDELSDTNRGTNGFGSSGT